MRLRSITCRFLENNLHLITYSSRNIQTHWKKFTLNATDSELLIQFSRVLTFSTNKLNPIMCLFLVNNLHFIRYFTHSGQRPDRQQPIKEPSLKYYPFLLGNVSSFGRDRNISLVRVYWRYNRVSVCFS